MLVAAAPAAASADAIARQPEAANTVSRTLFVGLAMIETMAIYCLVIALLLPRWKGAAGRFGRKPTTAVAANERAVAGVGAAVDPGPGTAADAAATGSVGPDSTAPGTKEV